RMAGTRMMRKEVDGVRPVTQRGNVNLDRIQAKEQGVPERASGRLCIHVGIGSCQHSHIHAPCRGRTNALEIPCFQNSQKFCLQVERNVRDFVQEQSAAVSELEPSNAIGPRIRKRTFYVAKKL